MSRFAFALVVVFFASGTGNGRAEDVALAWARGPGADACVDARALRRSVVARLGRDPFDEASLRTLDGVVRREAEGWEATLVLREGAVVLGERRLASVDTDCQALFPALVLAVALAIDPESVLAPPSESTVNPVAGPEPFDANGEEHENTAPSGERVVPLEAVAQTDAVGDTRPDQEGQALTDRPRSFVDDASLSAIGSLGLLPRTAVGVGLTIGGEIARRVRWQLGMRYHPDVSTDPRFFFGSFAGVAGVCYDLVRDGRFSLGVCEDVLVGALRVAVRELEPVATGEHLWVAARTSVAGEVRVTGPFYVGARLAVAVALASPRFRFADSGGMIFAPWIAIPEVEIVTGVHFD